MRRLTDFKRIDPLRSRGDVDPVAHQVAVPLFDHVAEVNAEAKFDALFGRHLGVALDHGCLDFDCAPHGVDHAAEFDDRAVASALDDAAVMDGDDRIDHVAAKRPETGDTRIAASFRASFIAVLPPAGTLAQFPAQSRQN